MIKYFTLVLDGHAKLAAASFPPAHPTKELDNLARESLREHNVNYGHGTSHGVGAYLNVHEMPPYFGGKAPLEPGMCLSNEPGYYQEGAFGIRIESVVVVKELPSTQSTDGAEAMMGFETLNYIPMQAKLINPQLLSETGRRWLNDYHRDCWQKVGPILKERNMDDVCEWLRENTKPI